MPARTTATKIATPAAYEGSAGDYLDRTREFWQRRTQRQLTREDAREISHNLLGFFAVLREWTLAEKERASITPLPAQPESPKPRPMRTRKKAARSDDIST